MAWPNQSWRCNDRTNCRPRPLSEVASAWERASQRLSATSLNAVTRGISSLPCMLRMIS
jgi:hypothetical protein